MKNIKIMRVPKYVVGTTDHLIVFVKWTGSIDDLKHYHFFFNMFINPKELQEHSATDTFEYNPNTNQLYFVHSSAMSNRPEVVKVGDYIQMSINGSMLREPILNRNHDIKFMPATNINQHKDGTIYVISHKYGNIAVDPTDVATKPVVYKDNALDALKLVHWLNHRIGTDNPIKYLDSDIVNIFNFTTITSQIDVAKPFIKE